MLAKKIAKRLMKLCVQSNSLNRQPVTFRIEGTGYNSRRAVALLGRSPASRFLETRNIAAACDSRRTARRCCALWRPWRESHPRITLLQRVALLLGYVANVIHSDFLVTVRQCVDDSSHRNRSRIRAAARDACASESGYSREGLQRVA